MACASGNQQKEGESLCHLAYVHWAKLHEDETTYVEQYATEALQLAHQTGDQYILAQSLASLGFAHQARGNLSEAERHLAESIQISRREGYHNALALSLAFLGLQVYWQGHFPRAAQLSQEGLAVSCAIHDSFDEFLTLAHVGLAHWGTGDCGQALTEQLQSPMLLYPVAYELGQWYETDGQEREAAALYRKAHAVITRMATALADEGLRTILLQSAAVQAIGACVARLGG